METLGFLLHQSAVEFSNQEMLINFLERTNKPSQLWGGESISWLLYWFFCNNTPRHVFIPNTVAVVPLYEGGTSWILCFRFQWLGPPCCLRGSFAFYKSVSCKPEDGGPAKVWRLGEFYYVRCGPQEPVCIAEITLLWEDQRQRHPLASSRLYYLPEDTPKGRTKEHGEVNKQGLKCSHCNTWYLSA